VFADCRADTLNVDESTVAPLIGPRTRAILVMHYGGVACEMDTIVALATRLGLVVIEDNAHGLFGKYCGRPLGSIGSMATQSFHDTKNVTSGEGGALLLNDSSLVERAEVLREKGTDRSRFFRGEVDKYTWVDLGSNFLSSEMQAAFLLAQLRASDLVQSRRAAIWQRYDVGLADWAESNEVGRPTVPQHCEHPSHLYYLMLPNATARTELIDHLKRRGILAVFHYLPLHLSPMGRRLGGIEGACPVAENVSKRLLRLPFYTNLSDDDQAEVIDAVRQFKV
jgi:dTDP-4-amino-4,6-dideoxygalactose transaminase